MDHNEIREQLLTMLKPFTRKLPPGFVVTDSLSLADDLHIDSADMVDLVLEIEERFGIGIPDNTWGQLKTVGDVVHLLEDPIDPISIQ